MNVLVCGGRDWTDWAAVYRALDEIHAAETIHLVVQGAARGADTHAEKWAKDRQVPYLGVPARWNADGKRAGLDRNTQMLDTSLLGIGVTVPIHLVVHLPGGSGTADMVEKAKASGVRTWTPFPAEL